MTDDLEQLLAALPLRRPTGALDARIAASFARPRWWRPARWAAAVAAAAVVAVAVVHRRPRQMAAPVAVSPVVVERDLSRTFDDGVVTVTDHVPYRRVRRETVRQIWWADPATGARLWAELPVDRVSVEPAETF